MFEGLYARDPAALLAFSWPTWRRDEDGIFRLAPAPSFQFFAAEKALESLPEYALALAALEADPSARSHLDQIVGTPMGGSQFQISQFLWSLIAAASDSHSPFDFRADLFDTRLGEVMAVFAAETVEQVTLMPLAGFAGTADAPFVLSDVTEVDRLTDAEIARSLSVGVVRGIGTLAIFQNEPAVWGIRVRQRLPKVVGAAAFERLQGGTQPSRYYERASAELERGLVALRVHRAGAIAGVGYMSFTVDLGPGQSTTSGFLAPGYIGFSTYEVTEADRPGIEGLASALASRGVQQRPYVENAARRFSFASERHRSDDRLLDLMIAAESLFLGHERPKGELRFRLALHAAHLLGSTTSERMTLAKRMHRAYDTRSAIVHGGTPKPKVWGSTERKPVTLDEFTSQIEGDMRRAIQRGLTLSATDRGRGPFFDWDESIYAAPVAVRA